MVTFSWEPLDSFVSSEVLQANIASFKAHVFVSFQENYGLDLPKVMVVVRENLLQIWRQSLSILSKNHLLVHDIICDASLHQENSILVEGPHKFLPSIDLILNIAYSTFKEV